MATTRAGALGGSVRPLSIAQTAVILGVARSPLYKQWRAWALPAHKGGRLPPQYMMKLRSTSATGCGHRGKP
jgi:hypothetical protein